MRNNRKQSLYTFIVSLLVWTTGLGGQLHAGELDLSDTPLFVNTSAPPLVMLTVGRDHKLYYEAYGDTSDLDNDGDLDIRYDPAIGYFGYFNSSTCYVWDNSDNRFEPSVATTSATIRTCSGASHWSGDYLNYLTTSRIDALRKVLYGGKRDVDTTTETVLAGAFIPQDAHSWGKEYTSVAVDGYDIQDYTPLSLPTAGNRHFFAVTSTSDGATPVLRQLLNRSERIWNWLSKERPVAGTEMNAGAGNFSVTPTDRTIRVQVCVTGIQEDNCRLYGTSRKPIGLLQENGENNSIQFGLLTGSYAKNTSGGVLRKNVGSITDEIDLTNGRFTNTNGIINTLDHLRVVDFRYASHDYDPGWPDAWIVDRPINEGEQPNWGNPIGEMMYEGLRYFMGKSGPTSDFAITSSTNPDASLGLPVATWVDPYAGASAAPRCAKAVQLVISDINPSYDTDQLPGSYFGSFTSDVTGLNCKTRADTITTHEGDIASTLRFIGESGSDTDKTPDPKTVTSLGTIRGLAPEEPTKLGGYYSASIGYFGHTEDIRPDLNSFPGGSDPNKQQTMDTMAVALASPLPEINIDAGGNTVTLVPFAKSPGWDSNIDAAEGAFQPTNQIVDFYVESITSTTGSFRINFEDVEQGADHDMDAIVNYSYVVNGDNSIDVTLTSEYAAGGIIQHMGYVISGTTADGVYLEVRDFDTDAADDVDYYLDTATSADVTASPGIITVNDWGDATNGATTSLPLSVTRRFTPGSSSANATLLKNPLWYAAKWGGFKDVSDGSSTDNDKPDGTEWDSDGDGDPDNYFLVTNPLTLSQQLGRAFSEIKQLGASSTAVTVDSGSIATANTVFQGQFTSGNWTGKLYSFPINSTDGSVGTTPNWNAATVLDNLADPNASRKIVTFKPSTKNGVPFLWHTSTSPSSSQMDLSQLSLLNTSPVLGTADGKGEERLEYLRGDTNTDFRARSSLLGDIVNSAPVYSAGPAHNYPDDWGSSAAENSSLYSTFKSTNHSRQPMVYVGGNDGMLHAFNAATGAEEFAYIPNAVIHKLNELTDPNYDAAHEYYVDGTPTIVDAFYNSAWHSVLVGGLKSGGQAVYALDVTDRTNTTATDYADDVLWEFTDRDDTSTAGIVEGDPDLGYTFSRPNIVRMHDGKWYAVFGNGYNNTESDGSASSTGHAVLYFVDIETGHMTRKIDTGKGSSSTPNGLATVAPVDMDADGIVDRVYGGDLLGNMWRFDVDDTDPANWDSRYFDGQ